MGRKLNLTVILIVIICKLINTELITDIYSNCDAKTSRCFGMPSDCIPNKNCGVLLTATPLEQRGADFKLYWNRDSSSSDRWVGAALSRDREMGDDSVTECILWKNNSLTVRQGLTYCDDDSNDDDCGVKTVGPIDGINDENGGYDDGMVYCSWSRSDDTVVRDLNFNIYDHKYYIMLARGPIRGVKLHHHSKALVTKEAEYLARPISTEVLKPISFLKNYFYEIEPKSESNDNKAVDIISLNPYQFIKLHTNRSIVYYRKTIYTVEEIRYSN